MLIRDKSYIAGFMDGEGSIGFQRSTKNNHIYPRVWVYNTHKPVILFIQELYGGHITLQSNSASKKVAKERIKLFAKYLQLQRIGKELYPGKTVTKW